MEKRRHKRKVFKALVYGHERPLAVFDVSESGVRLVGDFKPQEENLEFSLQIGGESRECTGRVAWWKPFGPSGIYQVGVVFTQSTGSAITQDLASLNSASLASEDRGALLNLSDQELGRLELVARISGILNGSLDIEDLLSRVMDIAMQTMGAERSLLLISEDGVCRPTITRGPDRISGYSNKVVNHVMTTGEPLLSLDAVGDTRLSDSQSIQLMGTRSVLCVPIRSSNRFLGLIYLDNSMSIGVFAKQELHLVTILADMAAAALERAEYLGFLAESREDLAAARDDLHSLVERNPDGILILAETGAVSFCNPSAEKMLGGSLLGERPRFIVDGTELREVPIIRADGTPGWGQFKAEPTEWDGLPATLVTLTDVTAIREKEEQLRHSQKMQAVGRLAGGIAHDFNNLLTTILGYCEILTEDESGAEEALQIQAAAERAASLTKRLLTFSRRRLRQPRTLDLNSVVSGFRRMLDPLIGEAVELRVNLDSAALPICADRDEIEQVILNLAINARESMPNGGVLTIETGLGTPPRTVTPSLEPGRYVFLRVHDSGGGIEKAVRERIFEPFFTTKEQGTGLGLATVYAVIEAGGGGLVVSDVPTGGTVFTAYLPAVDQPVSAPAQSGSESRRLGSEKLLVVEDEATVRLLLRRFLSKCGYHVTDVGSAEEALALGPALAEFQLLLTDVVLPGRSGLELARILSDRYPRLRTVVVSGYSEDILDERTGLAGGFPFLHKPFKMASLSVKLREVLES